MPMKLSCVEYAGVLRLRECFALAKHQDDTGEWVVCQRRTANDQRRCLRIPGADFDPDGGADEAEGFADLVFQETLIGEV
jgi:hypothetical protein